MIRVIKDWGIDADVNGYQVGKIRIKHDKKSKKDIEYLGNVKYPSSIADAIEKINVLQEEFAELLEKTLSERL